MLTRNGWDKLKSRSLRTAFEAGKEFHRKLMKQPGMPLKLWEILMRLKTPF
jgi:hypothetical protein